MLIYCSPAITIENAYLRYQNHILFQDLNCYLPAGKTTCLLGPSGVGKTSLLRMLASLPVDEKTEQSASIKTNNDRNIKNRISYLAQTDLLLPWLNCIENTLIGYRLRNAINNATRQQAKELLIKVGLEKALYQYPAQLSGGMRQRVALVRTLIENKPIVLMDEPFSALDTITRLQLQELTATLLTDKTVLLITHDPLEALRLSHQILIMSGSPAQLSKPIVLDNNPPRLLTDEQLLKWQGELMQQLTHAKETIL